MGGADRVTIGEYVAAVSEYVMRSGTLSPSVAKAAQLRLSQGLASALVSELKERVPSVAAFAGEREISGALRTAKADVSELHRLDGLRLAVELKPVNLAVGRAIWNRFGDIRTFAVNIHLKFPFAVVGGVLTVPTVEATASGWKSTRHLISRAIDRFNRAGGRRSEGDAPHLLEGIAVVAYDPQLGKIDEDLPGPESRLRWAAFLDDLASAYRSRFELD